MIQWVGELRSPFLDFLMLAITYFGNWRILLAMVFLIDIFLFLKKEWASIFALTVSVIGGEAIISALKHLAGRTRPDIIPHLTGADGFSFPSGHAFMAVSFFAAASYLLIQKFKSKAERVIILTVGAFFILAVGFSRVYLGVHWPTDVLGGYILASVWIALVMVAYRRLRQLGF